MTSLSADDSLASFSVNSFERYAFPLPLSDHDALNTDGDKDFEAQETRYQCLLIEYTAPSSFHMWDLKLMSATALYVH
ncbi:hypothetical protein BGZ52_006220, partial [Haplosporangium bisporale]